MKVTVVEAMRIQKEIAELVRQSMAYEHSCKYGKTLDSEGNELNTSDAKTYQDYVSDLMKLFAISEQINGILAGFSLGSGVSCMVRERENCKVLLRVMGTALQKLSPATLTQYQVVGNQRMKIVTTFKPYISKKEVKEQIKGVKESIRSLQSDIDKANAQMIELPFEYEDIEIFNQSED